MLIVPIASVANQSLSIVLDSNFYDISLQQVAGIVAVTISRNSETLISGQRAVAGSLILPDQYLQDGNFFFQTANLDLPNFQQFNITQNLVYLEVADIAQIMAATPTFQQYGSFPIRYQPTPIPSQSLLTEGGSLILTEGGQEIIT